MTALRMLSSSVVCVLVWVGAVYGTEPASSQDYLDRGKSRYNDNDSAGAEKDLTKAIELDPKNVSAYNWRANARAALGNIDGAEEDYAKALELDPRATAVYINRAITRRDRKLTSQAVADLNKAIELDKKYTNAYRVRAGCLGDQKNYDAALADYDKALESDPNDAYVYFDRGVMRRDMNLLPLAIADLTKSIELDPENAGYSYEMRALCFSDQKNYKDAITDCLSAIKLEPANGRFHCTLADTYRDAGKLADALNAYNKVLELLPKDAHALEERGQAKSLLGDNAGAIDDFTQAITLLPADSAKQDRCYYRRGRAKMDEKDLTGAMQDANQVLAHNPKHADSLFLRGYLYVKLGQNDAAHKDLDAAVAIDPNLKPIVSRVNLLMQRRATLEEKKKAANQSGSDE